MKKIFLASFIMFGILGYSQHTKKKVYRKTAKKSYVKKKPSAKVESVPVAEVTPEPKAEVIQETKPDQSSAISTTPVTEEKAKEDYILTAERILKKKGYINNRNSAFDRGIEGFIKGIYSSNGKLFFLVEIDNRTNIPYDILGISFISPAEQEGRMSYKEKETNIKELSFEPIWTNQPEKLERKSKNKMIFVFDKFTIAENRTLQMIMTESEGERTINLPISPKYILKAQYSN